jgi:hypothetical protein
LTPYVEDRTLSTGRRTDLRGRNVTRVRTWQGNYRIAIAIIGVIVVAAILVLTTARTTPAAGMVRADVQSTQHAMDHAARSSCTSGCCGCAAHV